MDSIKEALRQVVEGDDFDSASAMLKTIKAEAATIILPGMPYSLATNVAHADTWNRLWLARLEGKPKFNPFPDIPEVTAEEWPEVRDSFISTLNRAYETASAEPFIHKCKTDDAAKKLLLKIAVHTAYHLGQIKLLKRGLRSSKPAAGSQSP